MDAGVNLNLGIMWIQVLTLILYCVDAGVNTSFDVVWMLVLPLVSLESGCRC